MNILGFNAFMEDASACLIRDGEVVAAVQEERFTRKKHDGSFPVHAIRACLELGGITVQGLDHVAFNFSPFLDFHRRLASIVRGLPQSLVFAGSHGPSWLSMLRADRRFAKEMGGGKYRFHFVEHHMAHAASAFYLSSFEEAAVLTLDGSGESAATMLAVGRGNRIEELESLHFPQSLGYFYAAFTQLLGFKSNSGEGKVMGLASFGKDEFAGVFQDVVRTRDHGRFALDFSYFRHQKGARVFYSPKAPRVLGVEPRVPESEILPVHENIAASLQKRLEEVAFHIMNDLSRRTGLRRLCLAGGVALNCSMNGLILANTEFDELFVQPGANDAGGGLGAALYVWHQMLDGARCQPMRHAYLGPSYSDEDIQRALSGETSVQAVDPVERASELLSQGKVIGWFQGRSELGPRALGARSILADPRVPGMVDHLNAKVKFREKFRPFAPSVLEERAAEYFEDYVSSPFMLLKFDARKSKAAEIPAVVHVDGTSRAQGVVKQDSPLYHQLISRFEERTGVPLVLNTSFNLRGEPNVETPEDAVRTFKASGLEDLIIGGFHVRKGEGAESRLETAARTGAKESAA